MHSIYIKYHNVPPALYLLRIKQQIIIEVKTVPVCEHKIVPYKTVSIYLLIITDHCQQPSNNNSNHTSVLNLNIYMVGKDML